MRPFRRRRDGLVVGAVAAAEAAVLGHLLDQLDQVLDADVAVDEAVRDRLFPAGHATDEALARDYRDLTEAALRAGKADDLAAVRGTLPVAGGEIRLDVDQARAWLRTTNDLRLALGTRLGITADSRPAGDPGTPAGQQVMIYQWLTGVQGSLVDAVAAGADPRT